LNCRPRRHPVFSYLFSDGWKMVCLGALLMGEQLNSILRNCQWRNKGACSLIDDNSWLVLDGEWYNMADCYNGPSFLPFWLSDIPFH
jgi:hypothetical protein